MQQAPGFARYGLAQARFTMARLHGFYRAGGRENQAKLNLCGVDF
jgi:hypothetical protein